MEMLDKGVRIAEDHLLTDHTHDGSVEDKLFHVKSSMRGGVRHQLDRMQTNMRSNTTMWAGIAAGAGFGLGLLGRIMRRRAAHGAIPQIVIIEGTC